jgi:hypothetical protein
MADLRPGQYKRLGRIAENNPQRAEKVAARMEKRASRTERGKVVAKSASEGKQLVRKIATAEENPRAREDATRAREEARKKINEFAKQSENFVKKAKRPDTPLAESPIPLFLRSK